jgi:hypothetical protein
MTNIIDITYSWEINGACVAELEARVYYDYSPGTSDYFDRAYGNWLPGDPPEIEVENVELIELGFNIKKPRLVPCPDFLADLIADYAVTKCGDAMVENANEAAYDRQNGGY